jgi:hypothetical protein
VNCRTSIIYSCRETYEIEPTGYSEYWALQSFELLANSYANGHKLGVTGQLQNGLAGTFFCSAGRWPGCFPAVTHHFWSAYVCVLAACVPKNGVHTSLSLYLPIATAILRCHTAKRRFRSTRMVVDRVCHSILASSTA